MFRIELTTEPEEKSKITNTILRSLPDWFGIEETIQNYVQAVRKQLFYTLYDQDRPIGFLSIKSHNPYTAEIHVMGILQEYHRKGLGTKLVEHAERDLKNQGYKFLMVKTLGESHPDPNYQKTRAFYRKVGFYPLEEIKEIWGERNPCLIMMKSIL